MNTADFDYPLPPELIAQVPAQRRDESRLMVVDRRTGQVEHTVFRELPAHVPAGARFFRNSAAVFKARLRGQRATGGAVECLLLHPDADKHSFWCLLKPGKKLPVGGTFSGPGYRAEVLALKPTGERLVRFALESADNVIALTDRIGEVPLPPYIERTREADPSLRRLDEERYQTVYADERHKVAAAAPTAGLHFTPELLTRLEADGAAFYDVRLHVGLDTFQPIKADRIEDHLIHHELYEIPADARRALTGSDATAGPRICVGTTSLRACEDFVRKAPATGADETFIGEAGLFIYPPDTCYSADGLITNFHLPRSTLLCLVSAFLTPGSTDGIKWLKELYAEAIDRQYRFYSYGDAMFIRG